MDGNRPVEQPVPDRDRDLCRKPGTMVLFSAALKGIQKKSRRRLAWIRHEIQVFFRIMVPISWYDHHGLDERHHFHLKIFDVVWVMTGAVRHRDRHCNFTAIFHSATREWAAVAIVLLLTVGGNLQPAAIQANEAF
jgi:ABC-type sugar transport system permease subunit